MKFISDHIAKGISVIASLSLMACGGTAEKADAHDEHDHAEAGVHAITLTPLQIKTVDIKLGKIVQRPMGASVNVSGVLEVNPSDLAEVSPLWSGSVKTISVTEGASVGAGTVLATLENTELMPVQQDYQESIATLSLSKKELERQQALAAQGAGVRRNLERAEADVRVGRARADGLAARLRQAGINPSAVASGRFVTTTSVTSPIAGTVVKVDAVKGSYAQPGTPLFTVVNTSGIYAKVNLFEKDLPNVKPGDVAFVTLTNGDSAPLEGKVEKIIPGVDADTRAVSARISVPAAKGLMPGMAVTAAIEHSSAMVDAVPDDAVAQMEGHSYIFLLKEKSAEGMVFAPVEVKTGERSAGYVQIIPAESVPANATVVTANAFYIASMLADHGEHNH